MGNNEMININKKVVIVVIGFAVLLISIVLYQVLHSNKRLYVDSSITKTYIDPGSGETVIETPNKSPETAGGDNITMLGFSKLLDVGITNVQLNKIKLYFSDYSLSQETPIKEISIIKSSINQSINRDLGEKTTSFTVTINRKNSLNIQANYTSIDDMILKIYDSTNNTLLYNSSN